MRSFYSWIEFTEDVYQVYRPLYHAHKSPLLATVGERRFVMVHQEGGLTYTRMGDGRNAINDEFRILSPLEALALESE